MAYRKRPRELNPEGDAECVRRELVSGAKAFRDALKPERILLLHQHVELERPEEAEAEADLAKGPNAQRKKRYATPAPFELRVWCRLIRFDGSEAVGWLLPGEADFVAAKYPSETEWLSRLVEPPCRNEKAKAYAAKLEASRTYRRRLAGKLAPKPPETIH